MQSPQSGQPNDAPTAPQPETDPSVLRVQELEALAKEKENKYLYLYADFENFKKRAIKEREELVKFGWESVARELLQVADNLERAIAFAPQDLDKNFKSGVEMVLHHFKETLGKQGVKAIPGVGQTFDPNLHEAVAEEAADQPAGTILKEHLTGYTLHGRLLRPSRVVLSTGLAKSN